MSLFIILGDKIPYKFLNTSYQIKIYKRGGNFGMKKEIIGIFICMLLVGIIFLPILSAVSQKIDMENNYVNSSDNNREIITFITGGFSSLNFSYEGELIIRDIEMRCLGNRSLALHGLQIPTKENNYSLRFSSNAVYLKADIFYGFWYFLGILGGKCIIGLVIGDFEWS
jgi:hypothetical protein